MTKKTGLLILFITFSLTINAQKKRILLKKGNLTIEQQVTIKVKKMTLELELTEAQQNKLIPVLTKHITERKAQLDKRKKGKGEEKKIEANDRFKIANKILDRKIIFQKEMKTILNEEQFNRFKELQKNRELGMRKKGLKKKKRF
ncbi:MAG: hypothetical protein HN487_04455 [Flavobacterium sp.]|nr:hypothetical protein [Flavobacterium sp.]